VLHLLPGADEGSHPDLKQPLTHFFRRLTFQLDPAQYPGPQGRVVWDKVQHDPEHKEAIQLRRLGAAPVEALVTVELDHQPAQYRLSAALAGVLGLKGLHSVAFVMQMLWGYIKANSLYEVRVAVWICDVRNDCIRVWLWLCGAVCGCVLPQWAQPVRHSC
jgi:hypothetical protein